MERDGPEGPGQASTPSRLTAIGAAGLREHARAGCVRIPSRRRFSVTGLDGGPMHAVVRAYSGTGATELIDRIVAAGDELQRLIGVPGSSATPSFEPKAAV